MCLNDVLPSEQYSPAEGVIMRSLGIEYSGDGRTCNYTSDKETIKNFLKFCENVVDIIEIIRL